MPKPSWPKGPSFICSWQLSCSPLMPSDTLKTHKIADFMTNVVEYPEPVVPAYRVPPRHSCKLWNWSVGVRWWPAPNADSLWCQEVGGFVEVTL